MVSGKAALSLAGAKPADGPEYQRLRNVVEEMATAAGVPVPKTYVVDDPSPNAFATGRNPQHAAVTVTRGLLETMNRAELTGVVAHEIGHIKNRDISVTTLAVLTVGAIAVLADIAMRIALVVMATGRRGNSKEAGVRAGIALIALLVSFVLYIFALPAALILRRLAIGARKTRGRYNIACSRFYRYCAFVDRSSETSTRCSTRNAVWLVRYASANCSTHCDPSADGRPRPHNADLISQGAVATYE